MKRLFLFALLLAVNAQAQSGFFYGYYVPPRVSDIALWLDGQRWRTCYADVAGVTNAAVSGSLGRWETWSTKTGLIQATATNRPTWNAKYAQFDGLGDCLTNTISVNGYSVVAVVRLGNITTGAGRTIFDASSGSSWVLFSVLCNDNSLTSARKRITMISYSGTGSTYPSAYGSTALSDNNWYCFGVSVATTNNAPWKLYVNGVAETVNSIPTLAANTGKPFPTGNEWHIGSRAYAPPSDYRFDGRIAWVAAWNRELTAAEMLEIYTRNRGRMQN